MEKKEGNEEREGLQKPRANIRARFDMVRLARGGQGKKKNEV